MCSWGRRGHSASLSSIYHREFKASSDPLRGGCCAPFSRWKTLTIINTHSRACTHEHTHAHPLLTYIYMHKPPPRDLTFPCSISVLAESACVCLCVCSHVFICECAWQLGRKPFWLHPPLHPPKGTSIKEEGFPSLLPLSTQCSISRRSPYITAGRVLISLGRRDRGESVGSFLKLSLSLSPFLSLSLSLSLACYWCVS